jgi:hypothetical protein
MDEPKPKFTQDNIDDFKRDLDVWFEDYLKDGQTGEWENQLVEVFTAGYGDSFREIIST